MDEVLLSEQNLSFFGQLIPHNMQSDLLKGELTGSALVDLDYMLPLGVVLCRESHGWMELVWISVAEHSHGIGVGDALLSARIRDARTHGTVCGIFADLDEEDVPSVGRLLTKQGFTTQTITQNSFSTTLAQLEQVDILKQTAPNNGVLPLAKATQTDLKNTLYEIQQGNRVVPMPTPVDWAIYDQTCSAICKENGEIKGLILVSHSETGICLDVLYSKNQGVTAILLRHALAEATANYPPETTFYTATVNTVATNLLVRLLPFATTLTMTRMSKSFGATAVAPLDLT